MDNADLRQLADLLEEFSINGSREIELGKIQSGNIRYIRHLCREIAQNEEEV